MKKIILLIALILFGMANITNAEEEPVEFTLTISSGVTTGTGSSGETTLVPHTGPKEMIDGYVIKRLSRHDGYFSVQAKTLTAAETAVGASGTTFSLKYQASLLNDATSWNAAQKVNILNGMVLSGNTHYRYNFYPEYCNYMRFLFDSGGVTGYTAVEFKLSIK